jgi:hypothetical protein
MAISSDPRQHLPELVDQVNEPPTAVVPERVRQNLLAALLREIPSLQMPDHWPPRYPDVEPLAVAGEPASEQLIRERR